MCRRIHRLSINFQDLKHPVEERPVSRRRGVEAQACLALLAGASCLKVGAQPWNHPIPAPATESTAQTTQLADQLNAVGTRFFGAHWCPACKEQMKLFGKQAGANLNYVECGLPDKYPDQLRQCRDENIRSIPTWTRPRSTRLQGVQSINTLERWSGLRPQPLN